jgi:hypothetical protein
MVQAITPREVRDAQDVEAAIQLLSGSQCQVLEALAEGKTICAAASEAGVHRTSVNRWIHSHPAFRFVYNAWRRELMESTHARLLRACESASGVIQAAIDNGDAKLAFNLVKHMGFGPPPGPTSLDQTIDEVAIAEHEDEVALENRANRHKSRLCFERDERLRLRKQYDQTHPDAEE